jgi:hypothetical protein
MAWNKQITATSQNYFEILHYKNWQERKYIIHFPFKIECILIHHMSSRACKTQFSIHKGILHRKKIKVSTKPDSQPKQKYQWALAKTAANPAAHKNFCVADRIKWEKERRLSFSSLLAALHPTKFSRRRVSRRDQTFTHQLTAYVINSTGSKIGRITPTDWSSSSSSQTQSFGSRKTQFIFKLTSQTRPSLWSARRRIFNENRSLRIGLKLDSGGGGGFVADRLLDWPPE